MYVRAEADSLSLWERVRVRAVGAMHELSCGYIGTAVGKESRELWRSWRGGVYGLRDVPEPEAFGDADHRGAAAGGVAGGHAAAGEDVGGDHGAAPTSLFGACATP